MEKNSPTNRGRSVCNKINGVINRRTSRRRKKKEKTYKQSASSFLIIFKCCVSSEHLVLTNGKRIQCACTAVTVVPRLKRDRRKKFQKYLTIGPPIKDHQQHLGGCRSCELYYFFFLIKCLLSSSRVVCMCSVGCIL